MQPLEITRTTLYRLLLDRGVAGEAILLADDGYTVLSETDVTYRLAPAFSNLLAQLGFKYETERRDCDDFARLAAAWAGFLHGEQKRTPPMQSGLAFGEVWCALKAHAFCFGVHGGDATRLLLKFYEPQISNHGFSFAEIKLSRQECESIFLAKA